MEFKETKEFLLNNLDLVTEIYTDFKKARSTVARGIELIEFLIEDNPQEIDDNELIRFKDLVHESCEFLIVTPSVKLEREFIGCLYELLYNLNEQYGFSEPFELIVLRTLCTVRRTLDDELLILSIVLKKFSKELMAKNQDSLLSNKFLEEFNKYLSDHSYDSSYKTT